MKLKETTSSLADDLVTNPQSDITSELLSRYQREQLYTRVGAKVLVALCSDHSRTKSMELKSKEYAQSSRDFQEMAPHVFEIASCAYQHMSNDLQDQSIMLCGESGSGKSISRRLLIRNLCDLGRSPDAKKKSKVHSNILKVDNVLSSFAHAATPSNCDATCVIPYIEFQYNDQGRIAGIKLIDYLFEKSRVSGAQDGGRNFHIFHDLFDDPTKVELGLTDPAHFNYMANSLRVTGPQDRQGNMDILNEDLKSLGFGRRQLLSLWKLLATILHLGNISFLDNPKSGEACQIKNPQKLEQVAEFLGVPPSILENVMTFKMKKIGRDSVSIFLDAEHAAIQRDSLARALYNAAFSWIIDKINEKLCRSEDEWTNFISLLDLPGFSGQESNGNGLERLLKNYANEKLHYLSMETLLGESRNLFISEKINIQLPRVTISRQVIDLLTNPRSGVLHIVQQETAKQSADDIIIANLVSECEESSVFINLTSRSPFAFGVRHYAGVVEYDCRGFSELNSDVLQGDFVSLIRGSPDQPGTENGFLRSIFSDRLISTAVSSQDQSVVVAASNKLTRFPSMKRKKTGQTANFPEQIVDISSTISHQFTSNYEELLKTVVETNSWFIFHIQPILYGKHRIDTALVNRQVQYFDLALLKSHPAIMYSVKMKNSDFEERYGAPTKTVPQKECLLGKNSIFLKESYWKMLEKQNAIKTIENPPSDPSFDNDRDSDTASHYDSEFEYPRTQSDNSHYKGDIELNKTAFNAASGINVVVSKTTNRIPEKRPITQGRKAWLGFSNLTTFCCLPICLRICGRMKDKDRRTAWREKVALCVVIFLMNALILFLIVGIGYIICPKSAELSPGQISSYNNVDDNALVYMYGNYYKTKSFVDELLLKYQFQKEVIRGVVLGRDTSQMFDKSDSAFFNKYCPNYVKPSSYQLFPDQLSPKLNGYVNADVAVMTPSIKGTVVWDQDTLNRKTKEESKLYLIAYDRVYDFSSFYPYYIDKGNAQAQRLFFFETSVRNIFDRNANDPSIDSTGNFQAIRARNPNEWAKILSCMDGMLYVGRIDHRNDLKCVFTNYVLLAASIILACIIGFKFVAALQCYSYKQPEDHDKFVICQIPCYTEGEVSLTEAIKSLAITSYDDKHKLIFVICDGMIIGSGNDRPTPRIVLDILGSDPNLDPEPLAYQSLGEGNAQLNYAKIYSGLYEVDGHTTPYIVVVKVGKPSERQKPGNRGKRDSQLILMKFFSNVHFNSPMSPLQLGLYHEMKNVVGVDPSFYEYALMVDADTQVFPDAISRLVSHMVRDVKVAGTCGETRLSNENASFTTMIQIYEYFISHHLSKAFESLFSTVTCLPGCFTMYRLRSNIKNTPVLISPDLIKDYSENQVDTLHLRNLLHLGEDRYLTTLILKHFPAMRTTFSPDACCMTSAPDQWAILLSQRRRWINSTIHNLAELLFVKQLCGFCLFSMRFVVFIDLFATLVQPASFIYIIYLIVIAIVDPTAQIPLLSLLIIAGVYGAQVIIFLIRQEWQHIGWMIFYILATPLFAFYIPIYSFWHFDDFSWGNTRLIVEEKGKKIEKEVKIEQFNPNSVPLSSWAEFEVQQQIRDELEDTKSVLSFKSERNSRMVQEPIQEIYMSPQKGQSTSPTRSEAYRRKSLQIQESENGSEAVATSFPSDDELLNEIRHLLSTSDLMTVTKKKIRQQLGEFFGVDLSSKKEYIHKCIDGILRGEI